MIANAELAVALTTTHELTVDFAWEVLHTVLDPEVPVVSICDLGIVRSVELSGEHGLNVVLTPTYSGCPATELIATETTNALAKAGFDPVNLTTVHAPAWTSDWISAEGRDKLRRYGIAPPHLAGAPLGAQPLRFHPRALHCPRCDSTHTEQLSAFGSTACKALYRCLDCREPFDYFKPI